ncbi:methyl-accepting chemotaxis protein [Bradyrhizobium sp. CB2312]|uniref:methyl-accepting chemotaxis protein n=1 Tax=Bradyrhizobium sp. CB2312 TaxID=3039155 RepID=UPI0024B1DB77|nr:methyl-accepting chemotaxis protein [Bradyrhizobium sp. CB2312]WFU75457.1 cache domain-containing protein [Bradyrhizobium sp. CB2312]
MTKLGTSNKLLLMVGLSVLGLFVVAFAVLSTLRDNLLEDRKTKLKDLVQVAHLALNVDYERSRSEGLTEADAKARSRALLRSLRFGSDYFFATGPNLITEAHPNPKIEGMDMSGVKDPDGVQFSRAQVDLVHRSGSGYVSYRFPKAGSQEPTSKISYVELFEPYDWTIGSGIYTDDVEAIFVGQLMKVGALIGSVSLAVVIISLLIARSIVRPVKAMTIAMEHLASGQTSTVVPALDRADEIGAMAKSLHVFKDNMIEAERLRAGQRELEERSATDRRKLMDQMAIEFQAGTRASLDAAGLSAADMRRISKELAVLADGVARESTLGANAALETASKIQAVAAATEQLTASIEQIDRQVIQSARIAEQTQLEATRVDSTIKDLSEAAKTIEDVVQLISSIASQTNLLALNAAIEAARAGDAGRGFAVVAAEVKALASQTAKATEQIASQVTTIQDKTMNAVEAIEGISHTIEGLGKIAAEVTFAVSQQGGATREIALNIQRMADGTESVSRTISGVNRAAIETGTSASLALECADALNRHSAKLGADVDDFVGRLRKREA